MSSYITLKQKIAVYLSLTTALLLGCGSTADILSTPVENIDTSPLKVTDLTEAEKLAANGVKELILIAQELTFYGLDIYGERRLPELLKEFSNDSQAGLFENPDF